MNGKPIDIKRARQGLARLDALLETYPELREPDAQARLTAWLEEEQRAMADYAEKTRARVQRLRERRKQSGWTQHELWLDPASATLIEQLKQPGENVSAVVQRALQALAQHQRVPSEAIDSVTSDDTPELKSNVSSNGSIDHMDPRHRKAALVARLREMKAQGMSLDKIASELNREALPTLSGKGSWKKGTIGNLLAEAQDLGARGS